MDRLLPCPFCGGEASIAQYIDTNFYTAGCEECGAETMNGFHRQEDAVEAWNRRTHDPARVYEWAKADAEGRLVVLPCNLGDTIYEALKIWDGTECLLDSFKPHVRKRKATHMMLCPGEHVVVGTAGGDYFEIGKSAFTTYEDAEEAIEAGGGRDERVD